MSDQKVYSERELKRQNIQLLCDQGLSFSEVAKQLKVDYKTAKKWSTTDTIRHKYNTIHKKKVTPNTKRRISNQMKEVLGASVRKCVKKLNMSESYQNRKKTISKTSVQKYIKAKDWGKYARKLPVKPLLSQKNINDRLVFALNVQLWGYCDNSRYGKSLRENILWTDESPIELNPKPNKQNVRFRTSSEAVPVIGVPKFPLKIMVAGGITAQGVTKLYVCPKGETITGKVYEEKILPIYLNAIKSQALIPNKKKATFMQDSATCHNVRPVIQKIECTFPNSWTSGIWSGNSPDLNVIEPVWGILQDSVFENPRPRNREELVDRIQKSWHSLDPRYLANLVHSFPRRIEEAINNEGGHTSY